MYSMMNTKNYEAMSEYVFPEAMFEMIEPFLADANSRTLGSQKMEGKNVSI